MFSDVDIGFRLGIQHFFGVFKVTFDDFVFVRNEILYVVDFEKFFNVDFAVANVFIVNANDISSRNFNAALFENVFLIRNVHEIVVFEVSCAFYFVNRVSAVFLMQNINGADKKLHKTSSHKASPYQLILHNQHYYLVFFSEKWKKICHFRLDKITKIEITDEPNMPLRSIKGYENGLDYKKYATALPYMFTDEIQRVTFICDEFVIDQVVDWFGKNISIASAGDKKYEVTLYSSPNAMEYWAMQYLNYVEITSPAELRERIKNNQQKAEEKYK